MSGNDVSDVNHCYYNPLKPGPQLAILHGCSHFQLA